MDIIIYVVIAVIALIVGVVATLIAQKNMSQSRAKIIIEEANSEAEVIKKNKLLEAREEEIRIIAEAEKQASQRMSKAQSFEGKLKQRELQLNQQQSENQRSRNEIEQTRAKLDDQLALAESKQTELDALKRKAQEELERVSGLSSDEAKEKLIESLKDEAKTAAQSYINDIMTKPSSPPIRKLNASSYSPYSVWLQRQPSKTPSPYSRLTPTKSKVAS